VTANQHGQEQDKHQDAEQDFERLPDEYTRGRGIVVTVVCPFDAVSNPSQEFSSCSPRSYRPLNTRSELMTEDGMVFPVWILTPIFVFLSSSPQANTRGQMAKTD
jgi:hypothetical protein